jgi:RecB family exonuclease/superfamily I DNA/RNA helicase
VVGRIEENPACPRASYLGARNPVNPLDGVDDSGNRGAHCSNVNEEETSLEVVAHPDPFVLEAELLRRVGAAQEADRTAPVRILVPTRRLADHVQRRLVEHRRAWLNVEVLHFHALAARILENVGREVPTLLSESLTVEIVRRILREAPLRATALGAIVASRPGTIRSVTKTLSELREAGVDPEELDGVVETGDDAGIAGNVADLYRLYRRRLDATAGSGLVDHAGLVLLAAEAAENPRSLDGPCFVHGAYDLLGVHLDLLRRLGSARDVTVLLPAAAGEDRPATLHAREFARRHLVSPGGAIRSLHDVAPGGLLGDRLDGLYREEATFPVLERGLASFHSFQGAAAEVDRAVRLAVGAVRDGVPAREIAIVARSLEPYAMHLEAALDGAGIPWTSTLGASLRSDPRVHDLVLALRALADDFPRCGTAELLASPRIRWREIAGGAPPAGDVAEAWSRRAGLTGGIEDWTTSLAAWAETVHAPDDATPEDREHAERAAARRLAEARRIGRALAGLHRRFGPREPATWSDQAARVEDLFRDGLVGGGTGDREDMAERALLDVLDDMRRLDALDPRKEGVPFRVAVDWIEDAVAGTSVEVRERDDGGLRVLDLMQARGLTFRHCFLLGLQGDLFPRTPREDPFLDDAARQAVREATGKPVPVKMEGEDEERLLLSTMLGLAGERLHVSWQRADDAGRAGTPPLALREVARLVRGRPDFRGLVEDPGVVVPSHPRARLRALAKDTGLLAAREERTLYALEGSGPGEVRAGIGRRVDGLDRSLRMLETIESFSGTDRTHDGFVGEGAAIVAPLSVTSLERFGRCPLRFFFDRVLRVRPLEDETPESEFLPREMGDVVHRVLERTYSALRDEGHLSGQDVGRAARRGRRIAAEAWSGQMSGLRSRIGRRFEALWGLHEERWTRAILAFVERDVGELVATGHEDHDFERVVRAEIDLGDGVSVDLVGRFDRISTGGRPTRVADYKTAGKLAPHVDVTEMLRGLRLQVPLYAAMAGDGALVEILGVGPEYEAEEDPGERLARPPEEALREADPGIRETLRVLVSSMNRGSFPLRKSRGCDWCPYRAGCRRNHPPTRARAETSDRARELHALAKKNRTRKPLLRDVLGRNPEYGSGSS